MTHRQFLTLLYFIGLLCLGYLVIGLIFGIMWMMKLSVGLFIAMFVAIIIRHPPSKDGSGNGSTQ